LNVVVASIGTLIFHLFYVLVCSENLQMSNVVVDVCDCCGHYFTGLQKHSKTRMYSPPAEVSTQRIKCMGVGTGGGGYKVEGDLAIQQE
jgi:hypothetical protein